MGIISLQGVSSDGGPSAVPPADAGHWLGKGLQLRLSELLHPLSWKKVFRLTSNNFIVHILSEAYIMPIAIL